MLKETVEKLGIRCGRTYVRKGKLMLRKHSGYVKAKQFNPPTMRGIMEKRRPRRF